MSLLPSGSALIIFGFAFLISIAAVVSPGPVSAAIFAEAPRRGWLVGPLIAFGPTALEALVVLLIALGLTSGLASPAISRAIAAGGGLFMLWMGFSYIISAWKGKIRLKPDRRDSAPRSDGALVLLGTLTTISNPFWYTWWITVAAGYLLQARALGIVSIGAFYLGHISIDYAWDSLLGAAASSGARWLTDSRYRALIIGTGLFLLYLAAVFILQALRPEV